jgi:type I restriction enzyme, S subunit
MTKVYTERSDNRTLSAGIRLRFLFQTQTGATPASGTKEYWNGNIWWITPEDLGDLVGKEIFSTRRAITDEGYRSCATFVAPPKSLVLSKRAPIGQAAILAVEAACNQGCFLLTPKVDLDERFYYYCLVHLRPEPRKLSCCKQIYRVCNISYSYI